MAPRGHVATEDVEHLAVGDRKPGLAERQDERTAAASRYQNFHHGRATGWTPPDSL